MTKSNPPHLTNVNIKVWWHLYTITERNNFQLFHGECFDKIKEIFPAREITGQGSFVFSNGSDLEKNISLKETELMFSSNDTTYSWHNYSNDFKNVYELIFPLFDKHFNLDHLHLELTYIDFFPYEDGDISLFDFLSNNLKLNVDFSPDISFRGAAANLHQGLQYKLENGILDFMIGTASFEAKKGIMTSTIFKSKKEDVNIEKNINWLDAAHNITSKLYKDIIS